MERKRKEECLYSAFFHQGTHTALRHGSHSFTCKQHHACLSFVSVHQMAPPQQLRQQTSNCSLLRIYRPQKDERLSWPGWLARSGWFTHLSGHPSATGRVQDSESTTAKDRRSTTGPRNQPVHQRHRQTTVWQHRANCFTYGRPKTLSINTVTRQQDITPISTSLRAVRHLFICNRRPADSLRYAWLAVCCSCEPTSPLTGCGLRQSCCFATWLWCHSLHYLCQCPLPCLEWLTTGCRYGDWQQPWVASAIGTSSGLEQSSSINICSYDIMVELRLSK